MFAPYLAKSAALFKAHVSKEDAFEDENIISTENTLGGLAKLGYAHLEGTHVTTADLVGVFSRFPFTSEQNEAQLSHAMLIEQYQNPASIVRTDAGVKAAAEAALAKIKAYFLEQGETSEVEILSSASAIAIQNL